MAAKFLPTVALSDCDLSNTESVREITSRHVADLVARDGAGKYSAPMLSPAVVRTLRLAVLLVIGLNVPLVAATPGGQRGTSSQEGGAGISQLVERRDARLSCWGVVVRLNRLRFRSSIRSEYLEVVDAKHGRDLKPLMRWRVGRDRRTLVIEFLPGRGDFGSGNAVTVRIDAAAFTRPATFQNPRLDLSIATDLF